MQAVQRTEEKTTAKLDVLLARVSKNTERNEILFSKRTYASPFTIRA